MKRIMFTVITVTVFLAFTGTGFKTTFAAMQAKHLNAIDKAIGE